MIHSDSFLATGNQDKKNILVSRSAFGTLLLLVFLDNIGFAIVVPYLYFYLLTLGSSPVTYGLLLASYSLLSFIFTPIVARISDRFGRRKILLAALGVSSLSYFIFGSAQTMWILFVGRMLSGTTAATVPVAQAYVADVTTKNERIKYLGYLGAAAGLAFILGPAIGGTLSSLLGYALPSFLASALAFANLVLAYFLLPEPTLFRDPEKTKISLAPLLDVLKQKQILLLLSIYFLFFMSFILLQTAISPWLQQIFGFGSLETGLLFFFGGSINVFTQAILLPKLNKRKNRLKLIVYSITILTIGLLAMTIVQNVVLLLAIEALIFFSIGILYVTLNTLISINTSDEAQGGTLGLAWAAAALAQTIAPIIATTVFSFGVYVGYDGLVFAVSALIATTALPLALSLRIYPKTVS